MSCEFIIKKIVLIKMLPHAMKLSLFQLEMNVQFIGTDAIQSLRDCLIFQNAATGNKPIIFRRLVQPFTEKIFVMLISDQQIDRD